jgi:hypothetical protein
MVVKEKIIFGIEKIIFGIEKSSQKTDHRVGLVLEDRVDLPQARPPVGVEHGAQSFGNAGLQFA